MGERLSPKIVEIFWSGDFRSFPGEGDGTKVDFIGGEFWRDPLLGLRESRKDWREGGVYCFVMIKIISVALNIFSSSLKIPY